MNGFASSTVSFGIVVRDIEASVAFYRDALGLHQASAFHVPATMGGDSGLSDHAPFDVRVMKTDDSDEATAVKLMQFPGMNPEPIDQTYIHSSLGISYLTFHYDDLDEALARARSAGVVPIAKGPVQLPAPLPTHIHLALVRDPDGNLIEMLGPRKASDDNP